MIQEFVNYSVEIKNIKFLNSSGKRFPKSAIISFSRPGNPRPFVEIMGYLDQDSLFSMIDNNEDICLDECFIDRISLSEYRRKKQLNEKDHIRLNNFSARGTFIDSPVGIDLG